MAPGEFQNLGDDFSISRVEFATVDAEERHHCQKANPLVAIGIRVIFDDREGI